MIGSSSIVCLSRDTNCTSSSNSHYSYACFLMARNVPTILSTISYRKGLHITNETNLNSTVQLRTPIKVYSQQATRLTSYNGANLYITGFNQQNLQEIAKKKMLPPNRTLLVTGFWNITIQQWENWVEFKGTTAKIHEEMKKMCIWIQADKQGLNYFLWIIGFGSSSLPRMCVLIQIARVLLLKR